MTLEDRINGVRRLLKRVSTYHALVVENTLEPATNEDMKDTAKNVCDDVKAEMDHIKAEIDDWVVAE